MIQYGLKLLLITKIETLPSPIMEPKHTIRLKVKTNKSLNMIIAIEADKTMRELAHRVLNCYHELANEHTNAPIKRRDLTVSALKIDDYYVAKSQIISNMLNDNDQIQCLLAKAKPKYPNHPKAYQNTMKLITNSNNKQSSPKTSNNNNKNSSLTPHLQQSTNSKKQQLKSKKQLKKQKKMLKLKEQMQQKIRTQQNKIYLYNKIQDQNNQNDQQILKFYKKTPNRQLTFDLNNNSYPIFGERKEINDDFIGKQNQIGNSNQKGSNILANVSFASTISNPIKTQNQNSQNQQNDIHKRQKSPSVQKKQIIVNQFNREKQNNKNKNKINSILQMLSKATEQKQKRNKKKDKKVQKIEQNEGQSNKGNENRLVSPQFLSNSNSKQKEGIPSNKIASPKVTFHNSPMNSPQLHGLSSPKRKSSNPAMEKLQKMELEANPQVKIQKKELEKQKKQNVSNTKPLQSVIQMKKQNMPNVTPKIIVEEESEIESGQGQQKVKQETMPSRHLQQATNSRIAALDAKLSKYKLEFFKDSDNDQE